MADLPKWWDELDGEIGKFEFWGHRCRQMRTMILERNLRIAVLEATIIDMRRGINELADISELAYNETKARREAFEAETRRRDAARLVEADRQSRATGNRGNEGGECRFS